MLNIVLIGCGAIGSAVLELLRVDTSLRVVAIVVPPHRVEAARTLAASLAPHAKVVSSVPVTDVDLLVETAGHAAIEEHVVPALARGTCCVVASVGALSVPGVSERLEAAAATGGTQLQLIAGAVGAIDALAAARIGGLDSVTYIARKPPHAWRGSPAERGHDLDRLTKATVIFEGNARDAASLYPKNANVAATVSIAGLGFDKTRVCLIADPAVNENIHIVEAQGAFGSFELRLHNKPLASNPKTSALTVYSTVRALRNRAAALMI